MALLQKEKCLPIRLQSPEICTAQLSALLCQAEVKPGSTQVSKRWLQSEYQGPHESICGGRTAERGCVRGGKWEATTQSESQKDGGRL